MKLPFCVACGTKDDLQHHHLVTRAEGGGDEEANLITLYRLPRQIASTTDRRHSHPTQGSS
jgi:hypothetical protein